MAYGHGVRARLGNKDALGRAIPRLWLGRWKTLHRRKLGADEDHETHRGGGRRAEHPQHPQSFFPGLRRGLAHRAPLGLMKRAGLVDNAERTCWARRPCSSPLELIRLAPVAGCDRAFRRSVRIAAGVPGWRSGRSYRRGALCTEHGGRLAGRQITRRPLLAHSSRETD